MKILFICLGNICRSPMAEAIFNHKVNEIGHKNWQSFSAGTGNYHIGERPDHRTLQVLKDRGIESVSRAQNISFYNPSDFDYWVTMDENNRMDTLAAFPDVEDQLVLMRNFDSEERGAPVPDPYWGDLSDFEDVFDILDRSMDRFIEHLEQSPAASKT